MSTNSQQSKKSDLKLSTVELYLRYGFAGAQCASITHLITVPLDVVKTRSQTMNVSTAEAYRVIKEAQGWKGLRRGWGPTAVGYALQGACKFGFYELFKAKSVEKLGDYAIRNKLLVYAASGALAECIASFMLCPWEAVRIRMVSSDAFANNMLTGMSKVLKTEGLMGLYKGFPPIVAKQVPYTVVQFVSFQYSLDFFYKWAIPRYWGKTKDQLSQGTQLGVSTLGGVVAGVTSAIASHPPDTVLSRINMARKAGAAPPSFASVIKETGFSGLWRGIGIRCVMVGSISALMFLIYDSVKVMSGIPPTTGLGEGKKEDSHDSTNKKATKA